MNFANIFAGILGTVLVLIIRKRKEKKYIELLFSYKQELKSIASQILSEKGCQLPDGLIQPRDLLYLLIENEQQLTVHPLNNGKAMNVSKRRYSFLMRKLKHKQTICWGKGSIIYHRIEEPFDNCILLIKTKPLIKKIDIRKICKNDGKKGCSQQAV